MAGIDRLYIKATNRELIDKWKSEGILGLDSLETKEIFLFLAALGIDTPKEIQGAKDGYIRGEYIKDYDLSLIAANLLGKIKENEDIDKYCDKELAFKEIEKCVESGAEIFKNKVDSANSSKELLYKRILNELDLLYEKNIKGN